MHGLLTKAVWPKRGRFNDGSSVILGTDFDLAGPKVSLAGNNADAIVKELNALYAKVLAGTDSKWSSFRIEINSVSDKLKFPYASGELYTFVHGPHEKGSVTLDRENIQKSRQGLCDTWQV